MYKMKNIAILILIAFLFGCAPIDLTKWHYGEPLLCEIHNCEMHPEQITVGGESVYVTPYISIAKEQFPNHGGHLYNWEKVSTPYERDVIDFVCPKCDDAYEKYWSEK